MSDVDAKPVETTRSASDSPAPTDAVDPKRVFIGNLPFRTTYNQVLELFKDFSV